ncbi:hypothetical protein D3C78_847660 [compost metagenome]
MPQQRQQLVLLGRRRIQRPPHTHALQRLGLLHGEFDHMLPSGPEAGPAGRSAGRPGRHRTEQLARALLQLIERLRATDQHAQVTAAVMTRMPGTQRGEELRSVRL